jgi:methyltransferase family protein
MIEQQDQQQDERQRGHDTIATETTTRAAPADSLATADTSELRAAEVALPLLFEVYRPGSVLHVGCGSGAWLSWFGRYGVEDRIGVDLAHPVDGQTFVERDRVVVADVRAPFDLNRSFDLVVALELASRVDADQADIIIDNLVRHGDAILFSAAIPGQGGPARNEQWPGYWIERFDRRGLVAIDCVRPRWWNESRIPTEYRQNTFLMVSEVRLAHSAPLRLEQELRAGAPLAVVHPDLWSKHLDARREAFAAAAARPEDGELPTPWARLLRRLSGDTTSGGA